DQIAKLGLPKGREVDTIRALWEYERGKDVPQGEKFDFFYFGLNKFYDKLMAGAFESDKERTKSAFVHFYTSFLDPPDQLLGSSALYRAATILNADDVG